MNKKLLEFNTHQKKKDFPILQSGDIVKIQRKIIEGKKEMKQAFEGIVIAVKGKQSSSPMITVRKVSRGVGVELVLPLYSPTIEKIEIVKRAKIRRSKLYYIRDRPAKSLKMKHEEISSVIDEEESENPPEK